MTRLQVLREIPGKGYLVQLSSSNRREVLPPNLLSREELLSCPPLRKPGKKTNIGDPMPHGRNPAADSYKNRR
jgi:hypothetical protein